MTPNLLSEDKVISGPNTQFHIGTISELVLYIAYEMFHLKITTTAQIH